METKWRAYKKMLYFFSFLFSYKQINRMHSKVNAIIVPYYKHINVKLAINSNRNLHIFDVSARNIGDM